MAASAELIADQAGLVLPLGSSKLTFEYTWAQTKIFSDNQYFTMKVGF